MSESFHDLVGRNHSGIARGYDNPHPVPPVQQTANQMTAIATAIDQLGVQRWAERGDNFYGVGKTHAELAPGIYRCTSLEMIGPALTKQKIDTDNLIEMPDDAGATLLTEFQTFWQIGDKFRARGFLQKRGFLLWGPPGGGKTSMLMLMCKRLISEQQGVVLFLDHPGIAAACLQMARKIEPQRPMIAIMEDFDALVRMYGENEYLALLDGEAQVDRIVYLSTTNYPELLDPRFTDRPSRFDTIRLIGMPSPAARRLYLSTKEPSLTKDELDAWVDLSEGFSVAHLKEMIIAVRCFDQSLQEVVERLEQMRWKRPTSSDVRPATGFLNGGGGHGLHARSA